MKNKQNNTDISLNDKLKTLLKPSNLIKLVLVQQHELERINLLFRLREKEIVYIEQLYQHYIVQNKTKTYLY